MPLTILSSRTRISSVQASKLLKCYAERMPPKKAAEICGLSLNTLYLQYDRIRWRLILSGYYQNGARSIDEEGLSPEVKRQLKLRRGISKQNIYLHAAELIEWADEWPPRLVLKYIKKIIEFTGALDIEPNLTEVQLAKLRAYVRYARVELIYERRKAAPDTGENRQYLIDRAKSALEVVWRSYRAASKRQERTRC